MEITVLPPIDFLDLQRLHEALRPGIVVGIARPAHADRDPAFFQPLDITRTCILHPTIGVMYQSEFWLTLAQRRFQSLLGKLAVQLSTDTPSHHSPGIHVQNYRQVNELLLQPNVGYIRHPELVDTV